MDDPHQNENEILSRIPEKVSAALEDAAEAAGPGSVVFCITPKRRSDGVMLPVVAIKSRVRTALDIGDNLKEASCSLSGILVCYKLFLRQLAADAGIDEAGQENLDTGSQLAYAMMMTMLDGGESGETTSEHQEGSE